MIDGAHKQELGDEALDTDPLYDEYEDIELVLGDEGE